MNKNIGLITCFLDNYGACLQAYALQTVLEEYVDQVEIIRYLEPEGYDNTSLLRRVVFNPVVKSVAALILPNYRHKLAFRAACSNFRKRYLRFGQENYYTYAELKQNPPNYDAFVCGSDQIWNPTFYGEPNKAYYLDFVGDKKRIAYAPSIGVSDIDENYRREFIRLINQFDFLSVREKTGNLLIVKYCGKDAKQVLDPTLLIAGEEWRKKADNACLNIKEKYIFCYLFGDRPFYYQYIAKISKKIGLPVYIIPFVTNHVQEGFHPIYGVGPLEFVKLISNAALVITDSFHATAFSINMNVPFYSLLRNEKTDPKGMNSRIYDILSLSGLENRLWEDDWEFTNFTMKICWDNSNAVLKEKRLEDKVFLENALNT